MLPVCPCFNEEFDVAEGELPEMKLRAGFASLNLDVRLSWFQLISLEESKGTNNNPVLCLITVFYSFVLISIGDMIAATK